MFAIQLDTYIGGISDKLLLSNSETNERDAFDGLSTENLKSTVECWANGANKVQVTKLDRISTFYLPTFSHRMNITYFMQVY